MGQWMLKMIIFFYKDMFHHNRRFVEKPSLRTNESNGGSIELQNSNAEPIKKPSIAISCITHHAFVRVLKNKDENI